MPDEVNEGTTPAPEGRIYVCGACGRTSATRYGFKDSSCMSNAVLCYVEKKDGVWQAVDRVPEPALCVLDVIESAQIVQFTKPEHEPVCNCRLCRTARRAEGK